MNISAKPVFAPFKGDREIIKFVGHFRAGIIEDRPSRGHCFMVCAPLVTLLNMHGVNCRLVHGEAQRDGHRTEHYWLALADGRVLDPTADQFDLAYPPVYLGAPLPIHRKAAA